MIAGVHFLAGLVRQGLGASLLLLVWISLQPIPVEAANEPEASVVSTKLDGDLDEPLRTILIKSSDLLRDPKSFETLQIGALKRRSEADAANLVRALNSEGYFDGDVRVDVGRNGRARNIVFSVVPGPKFSIAAYRIVYTDAKETDAPIDLAAAGIEPSNSAKGQDLAALEFELIASLREAGYPMARAVERYAELHEDRPAATIVFHVESGPAARFGPLVWVGLDRTKADYLEEYVSWDVGTPLNRASLEALQQTLMGTGLFQSLKIEPGTIDQDGVAPVIVTAVERKARTVGVGVSYSTNTGISARAFWQHRNVFGAAEQIQVEATAGEIERGLLAELQKPLVSRRAKLFGTTEIGQEDSDAYRTNKVFVSSGLEKSFRKYWALRAALEIEVADTRDAFSNDISYLSGVPVEFLWNNVDDKLDPKKGARFSTKVRPVAGSSGEGLVFVQFDTRGVVHRPLNKDKTLILSGWTHIGATSGADAQEIPATQRFFAGGSGSVRGFGYQKLGELDDDGTPLGGRSLIEAGLEARLRLRKSISAALFFEGGSVFDDPVPALDSDMQYGAGVGVRYHTPVGPIRVDLAFPIDRRSGVDDPFQIYFGIGQAF